MTTKGVWHKPIFGLLNQNQWIPTQYAPLTFEFTLQGGAQWCDTNPRGDGGVAVLASTTYELRSMCLHYDIATLDSQLNNQFANMLKSSGAMNFVYESALMTTNVVLSPDFTTQVLRNIARVMALMSSFSSNAGDPKNKPGSNEMYLPPSSLTRRRRGNRFRGRFFRHSRREKADDLPHWPAGRGRNVLATAAGGGRVAPVPNGHHLRRIS